jgi:opacity protein-like surface antigen
MKRLLAVVLCLAMPIAMAAADIGYKVAYDGGSIPDVKAGMDMKLYIEADQIRLVRDKKDVVTIPASKVTEISYGQDVHRRVGAAIGIGVVTLGVGALMALTKSKKHFVGLTWANGDQKGGFAMQCDKNDYRGLLMGLEGVTGKKSVDSATMGVKN